MTADPFTAPAVRLDAAEYRTGIAKVQQARERLAAALELESRGGGDCHDACVEALQLLAEALGLEPDPRRAAA